MSRAIPGVQPCVDFAHLYARSGDGTINTYDEWVRMLEAYAGALGEAALGELHIHLSGIEYGPKGEKNHVKVLECELDLQAIYRALAAFHCRGRILCESPAMEDDALVLKAAWEELCG
jgi:deoxyribonuclease-4